MKYFFDYEQIIPYFNEFFNYSSTIDIHLFTILISVYMFLHNPNNLKFSDKMNTFPDIFFTIID